MKNSIYLVLIITLSMVVNACNTDETDTEKPNVDVTFATAFPTSCDTLYFDEPFVVKVLLVDNAELGSYNIDIHHNFDQHTHSTEFEVCTFDGKKTAVNPYTFIQDYTIPEASTEYTTDITLTLPSSDGTNPYDEGDYHFQIKLTDKEGWSTLLGLNVKILRR